VIGNPLPFVAQRTVVLNDGVTYNNGDWIDADVFARERQRDVLMSAGYVEQYWDMHFRRSNLWLLHCRRPSHHPAGDETVWDASPPGPLAMPFAGKSVTELVNEYGPDAVSLEVFEQWLDGLVDDEPVDVDGDAADVDVYVDVDVDPDPVRWSS